MPYASIDDNMTEHPKVERLGDAAFRVYVTSICFCARNLTDGLILRNQAAKVGASPRIIRELVAAACWDEDALGWRVHDYLEWNKSREQVLAYRGTQKAKADARWNPAGNAAGHSAGNAGSNALLSSPLLSSPNPSSETTTTRGRTFALYEGMGWTISPAVTPKLTEIEDGYPSDWVEDAFRFGAEARARNIGYIVACLKHWKEHGRDCECSKPETRGKNGRTGAGGNDLRQGGAANHRGKPREQDDFAWVERSRLEQIERRRELGVPTGDEAGAAAADVG